MIGTTNIDFHVRKNFWLKKKGKINKMLLFISINVNDPISIQFIIYSIGQIDASCTTLEHIDAADQCEEPNWD